MHQKESLILRQTLNVSLSFSFSCTPSSSSLLLFHITSHHIHPSCNIHLLIYSQVLDLAVESGATTIDADVHVGTTIGVVLAIIVFILAFADALVISGGYVMDVWVRSNEHRSYFCLDFLRLFG
jgi:hypothetical protein